MARMTRAELLQHIEETLTELWLYDEFGKCELVGTSSRINAINALGQIATIALGIVEGDQDIILDEILIELHELKYQDVSDAERVLGQILSKISPGKTYLTDQDKMSVLASFVVPIIQDIRSKLTFEEARHSLDVLNRIATVAARLAFSGEAKLFGLMDIVVRTFEHAEEKPIMRLIYRDITKGELLKGLQ